MVAEIASRRNVSVRCPKNGLVQIVRITTDQGKFAWCKRSALVFPVPLFTAECPLLDTTASPPKAAAWACPWSRALLGK